jgi:hypothetical protein
MVANVLSNFMMSPDGFLRLARTAVVQSGRTLNAVGSQEICAGRSGNVSTVETYSMSQYQALAFGLLVNFDRTATLLISGAIRVGTD